MRNSQGPSFHAIECDEVEIARVSLVPIRPGICDLHVSNVSLAIVARPRPPGGGCLSQYLADHDRHS